MREQSQLVLVILAGLHFAGRVPAQPPDLDDALERATHAAVSRVAPCVVQIRTVGGLELVGTGGNQVTKGQGPTTGVIVSPDGFIISSSFNFAQKPTAITVMLPNAKEPVNARIVAQDQTRMLTLLKVEATGLPVPVTSPKKDMKLGQWTLAVGRTWSDTPTSPPSVSVGIISALDRIWGKAIQTDAKVSPVNWGGPLIDMQGRVMGILVPMSQRAEGETAGVEWYDSGIGFAIPMEDVNRVLPQLKEGKSLKRGILGVRMQSENQFSEKVTIVNVAFESPAARAGIKDGDVIIEIDGKKVERQAQLMHVLGNKYEGDKVSLKVKRGDTVVDLPNLQLAGEPGSHVHGFLGILPMRDDPEPGVEVRFVYPGSAAEKAGIKPGDRILKIEARPFSGRDQFTQLISSNIFTPGSKVKFEVKHKEGGKTETVTATLTEMGDAIPDKLAEGSKKKALEPPKPPTGDSPFGPGRPPMPPPMPPKDDKKKEEKKDAKTGLFTKTDPASGHEIWMYVPEDYNPNISYALLVWLHPAGDSMDANILRIWRDLCQKNRVILLAPKAENPTGWLTSEVDTIKIDIREVLKNYTIDKQRIVAHGLGKGADLAFYLAFDGRDLIRGVAAIGGVPPTPPKENLAGQRLAFYLLAGARDPAVENIRGVKPKLTDKRFPVIYKEIPDHGNGYVTDADLIREMVRWMEALDRV